MQSSTKEQIDISIFATNYNNGKFLVNFFKSIINSTVLPKEMILVDDGSTDNSLEIIEQYQYLDFLKVIIFPKNKGRAAALNEGKIHCSGKYTLLIDPDDILLPERMHRQYQFMESNPDTDVCGGNVQYFNSKTGKNLNESCFPQKNIYDTFKKGENGVLQPTVIIKTNIYKTLDYKDIMPGEDYDFFARLAKKGCKFNNLPDVLNRMRIHPKSSVSGLTHAAIKKIFDCRDEIFNTNTSVLKTYSYYLHLKWYRKAMLSEKKTEKIFFIIAAACCYPMKIVRRLKKSISSKTA